MNCRNRNASTAGTLAFLVPALVSGLAMLPGAVPAASGATLVLKNAVVHPVSSPALPRGTVVIENGRITQLIDGNLPDRIIYPADATVVDLKRQHLYPGLIAVNTSLGLTEIEAVRATQDTREVGTYTPEVTSWVAVNPDSELLPVARANGIAAFEPVPAGGVVAGQSALLAMDGWTWEQMLIRSPVALHVYWPDMQLAVAPKEQARDTAKWKSIDEQAKERQAKIRGLQEFFDDARAYAKGLAAGAGNKNGRRETIPAWEAMLPFVRGELPVVIHANDVRQIESAVHWAATNGCRTVLAGGRDAWKLSSLLATNRVPVIYDQTFAVPARDTEPYDIHFAAPELLRKAGVEVLFSVGPGTFNAANARNLPYAAAQAVAFGLPEDAALKGITLYPAQIMGVADRLGSIAPGKDGTLFAVDGSILDVRSKVQRMWVKGREVSLENRQTRLYERYWNRPVGK